MSPYEQGEKAGIDKDTALRGLMRFGLSCSVDFETEKNTREWLKGFEDGFIITGENHAVSEKEGK